VTAHGRPGPLLTRAHVTAAVSGLVSLLVTLRLVPATLGSALSAQNEAIGAALFLVLTTAPVYLHAFSARKVVTPVADPRAVDGSRLVPVHSAAAEPSIVDALAAAASVYSAVTAPAVPVAPRDPYAGPVAPTP
jgi:hypothetical protein